MAFRFCDSVQHYNGTFIDRKWTSHSLITYSGSGGRRNSPTLTPTGGNILKTLTHRQDYTVGCAAAYLSLGGNLITMANNGVIIAAMRLNNDHTISLISNTVVIATTTLAVADPSQFHFYEMEAVCSGSGTNNVSVSAKIHVDGANFGSFSGTGNIIANQLIDGSASMNQVGIVTNGTMGFHDFYAIDSDATDINGNSTTITTFLGDVEVDALFPNADVTTAWSTHGGDGTHAYTCVNETSPDDDTTYVFSTVSGDQEEFNYQPIVGFNGTLVAAQYLALARKTKEGTRILDLTVGGTPVKTIEFQAVANYLSDFYVYYIAPLDTDNTTVWTTAVFNAEKFGVKVAN